MLHHRAFVIKGYPEGSGSSRTVSHSAKNVSRAVVTKQADEGVCVLVSWDSFDLQGFHEDGVQGNGG